MGNSLDFVKGNCGWDTVTLIIGEQVPEGQEIETALKILGPPVCGGIEVGFMYRSQVKADVRLRIVDSTHKTWMPMCGGMSQVIGKALVETSLREHSNIIPTVPVTAIRLLTDSGIVPLEIEIGNGRSPKSDNGHVRLCRLSIQDGCRAGPRHGCRCYEGRVLFDSQD